MRLLIFHGYLLRGTGSNVYNASLTSALARLGHEVHLLCQDQQAGDMPFVDAVGRWEDGELRIETRREPVRCTAYLPDIGRILPVYVADEYDGFDATPYPDLSREQVEHYVEANAAAVREVAGRASPDVALANHLVMGPCILARGLESTPYAVKVHGSALTYTVAPHRERFLPYAEEGLAKAKAVLVGSRHTAEGLWEVMDDPQLPDKTRLGPPGVDADTFIPRPRDEAAERLLALAGRLEAGDAAGWGGEAGAATALRELDPARDRIVSFVGKLIVSKGVDLLVAAWPLVTQAEPAARLVMVGFGTYREGVGQLVAALRDGDLDRARDIAARGRELEGGKAGGLRYLAAFFDGLEGERGERYLEAARGAMSRVHFTGRLEHSDLPDLLPVCEAQVVPSTWPEAFGMVAAEAASCGALPVSAAHSGLAEVSLALAQALPQDLRELLSFELGPGAVEDIADRLVRWLTLDPERRAAASRALSELARERFSWEGVAAGVIAAAEGRLDALPNP